jgi:AAA+ superfamily predicted ATPase
MTCLHNNSNFSILQVLDERKKDIKPFINILEMDIKEIVKLQFVSQLGQTNKHGNILSQILLMGLMSIIEEIAKGLPKLFKDLKDRFVQQFSKRVIETIDKPKTLTELSVTAHTKHFLNSLSMMRTYASEKPDSASDEANTMADSILDQVSKLTNVPSMRLISNGQILITYRDKPIQMTKDIFFKVEAINYSAEGGVVSSIKFCLQSNTLSASEITAYVKNTYNNYLQEIKNSLGDNIYFFDQKSRDGLPPQMPASTNAIDIANHKQMLIKSAPKQLSFTMSPFYSNKKFSNVYGEQARLVEQRVRFFIDNKDWYDAKGIPYQLGILLSGAPGSGKTSLIRAMANATKRHIINVNFSNITTASQLKNLFYSDKIQVYTDSSLNNTQSYFIPIDKRLYVLEEIDAAGDIVKQRVSSDIDNKKTTVNDELTLAEILTVIDGTMEVPGRILIMTSNHPEVLDEALIRPGRIDVQVEFGYAKRELIAEMYKGYMDKEFPESCIQQLPDQQLSPAEVGQVLFKYYNKSYVIQDIVQDMLKSAETKKTKQQALKSLPKPEDEPAPPTPQIKTLIQEQVLDKYHYINPDGSVPESALPLTEKKAALEASAKSITNSIVSDLALPLSEKEGCQQIDDYFMFKQHAETPFKPYNNYDNFMTVE